MDSAPLMKAPPRWVLFLVDHNPFYLLSAVCMLGGCLALTNSLSFSPIQLERILLLIVTLNVYELLLLGLGLFLLVKRGLPRDGYMLLLLEMLFLADVAFLNAEVFAIDVGVGLGVNAALAVIVAVKLWVLFRVLKLPMGGAYVLALMEVLVLFATPGLFAHVADGREGYLPALAVYGGWWLAGSVPVMYAMMVWRNSAAARLFAAGPSLQRAILRTVLIVPMLSLLLHLCTSNWVYKVWFHPANVGPVLLGLGVLAARYNRQLASYGRRMKWAMLLPIIAVVLSHRVPHVLVFEWEGVYWSPLRLALVAAAMVYLDGVIVFRSWTFAVACVLCAGGSVLGVTVQAMSANVQWMWNGVVELVRRMIPRTTQQWGLSR